MTDAQHGSDAELIRAARNGDGEAYAELFRRHSGPARRFARSLGTSEADADDLVAEAFARVLAAIRGGNGPDEAFRPYLLSAARNAFYDSARRSAKEQAVDDLTPLAPGIPFVDPVMAKEESRLVATAFGELPERWQVVLWHTEVEGEKPAQVAPLLGISANAVAALAYRAREGLRERYLQAHLATTTDEACRPVVDKLGAYTRQRLTPAETAKVREHLDTCDRCALLFGQLSDVNSRLGALVGPVVLGGAALALVASAGTGTTAGIMAGSTGAGRGAIAKLRRLAKRREAQVAGAGVLVVALVAVTLVLGNAQGEGPGTSPSAAPAAVDSPASPRAVSPSATTNPGLPGTTPAPGHSSTSAAPPTGSTQATTAPTQATTAPTQATTAPSSPAPPTTSPPVSLPPVALEGSLDTVGSLVRGRPGVLALSLTQPRGSTFAAAAGGDLTATFTLPNGVTLRAGSPGDGWRCAQATCTHPALEPGGRTTAYVPVSVSATAASGAPSVRIAGAGFATTTVTSSRGIEDTGLGAVFARTGTLALAAAGNSLLSCPHVAWGCLSARAGGPGPTDNNDYVMTPYTAPGAPAGYPSGAAVSEATVALAGDVEWAGLYWAGSGTAPVAPTAYVRPPGAGSYQAVTAHRVEQVPASRSDPAMYQATADITDLAGSAEGTWWVAVPASAFSAGVNSFAGWSVVVVVRDGSAARTVAVFDVTQILHYGGDSYTSTVYGLPAGPVTAALVAWEGDRGTSGDSLDLGAGKLGGSAQNNIARSQSDGTPGNWNTFGTDARVLTGTLGADGTLTAATLGDTWMLGALALAA